MTSRSTRVPAAAGSSVLAFSVAGPRHAGHRHRDVRSEALPGAGRHRRRRLAGNRTLLAQDGLGHAELRLLQLVRIRNDTAEEDLARTGHRREARGD